jgi:alpha-beta hydrolase superfamily lysophospholipase
LGLFAERNGWTKCVEDLWLLNRRIASEHPGVPIVLLGHSLGSFMTQYFISEHGETLAAAALSGSNRKPPPIAAVGFLLARLERLRLGRRGHSPVMQALFFGAFNKPFEPARTPFDWLSRDNLKSTSISPTRYTRGRPVLAVGNATPHVRKDRAAAARPAELTAWWL